MEHESKISRFIYELMLSLPPSQQFFNHVKMFPGLKQYLAEDSLAQGV